MAEVNKISLVVTVLNEEKSLNEFLESVLFQSRPPEEVVIVDGGSNDRTSDVINKYEDRFKKTKIIFKFFRKITNRSQGRNYGVKKSSGDIVAISDAGNILDKRWLENIILPFDDSGIDVVAGYYKGYPKNTFEKSLVPYVLVMPQNIKDKEFLPATRSMAIRKNVWEKTGGLSNKLNYSEDYEFSNRLKRQGYNIYFQKKAIVYWRPRSNLRDAFIMFFNFAKGDVEAGLLRDKVLLIFARYIFLFYLIFLSLLYKSLIGFASVLLLFFLYILFAIIKNYKHVKNSSALAILPVLQFTSDVAVLTGTARGYLKKVHFRSFFQYISNNKFLVLILFFYIALEFFFLRWGTPNAEHPFPYHMDEWHQFNAVRATFAYGTPNTAGAANGTMLHFIISGLYLVPFTLGNWINPAIVAIDDVLMRGRIFDLLRLNTIFYGVFSIIFFYHLSGYLKAPKKIALSLFVISPLFLLLSGYFKYDIALVFWLLLAGYFLLKFCKEASAKSFVIASIPVALAIAVKVSAIPFLLVYIISFFVFGEKIKFKFFIYGMVLFLFILIIFGMPDVLFGRGNIISYLYDNIIVTPSAGSDIVLSINPYLYINFIHIPQVLGFGLWSLFGLSIIYIVLNLFISKGKALIFKNKPLLMLIIIFLSLWVSLVPLQLSAAGNRIIVILPFAVLITTLIYKNLEKIYPVFAKLFITVIIVLQVFQVLSWLSIKNSPPPQVLSSEWIKDNIVAGEVLGIENIPIYQHVPDLAQKEFYYLQAGEHGEKNRFKYQVIDFSNNNLPKYVIISNSEVALNYYRESEKKKLVQKLGENGYRSIENFEANLTYFNLFGSKFDFYTTNIVTIPSEITIFKKFK